MVKKDTNISLYKHCHQVRLGFDDATTYQWWCCSGRNAQDSPRSWCIRQGWTPSRWSTSGPRLQNDSSPEHLHRRTQAIQNNSSVNSFLPAGSSKPINTTGTHSLILIGSSFFGGGKNRSVQRAGVLSGSLWSNTQTGLWGDFYSLSIRT